MFEEKSVKIRCEVWNVEERFVYLRREGCDGVVADETIMNNELK